MDLQFKKLKAEIQIFIKRIDKMYAIIYDFGAY